MSNKTFEATLRHPVLHFDGAVIIDLHGEINGSVDAALNMAFEEAEAQNPENIILNFTNVDYINSTGIALIVGLLARARKARRTLTVFGLSEHYTEIFNITRLVDFMNIFPDEQSAVNGVVSSTAQAKE